ncbi:MAG: DUF4476 domain-containing protein [Chitinophagaceae bacterium]
MKKISTLFASFIMIMAVAAAPAADARPQSSLTIQSADRGDVRVVIDGRRFEPNDNYLRIQGLDAGNHNIKVYRQKNTGLFNILGKRYEVVFNSSVHIRPRTEILISVDRAGRSTVSDNRSTGWPGRNDRRWDDEHDFRFDRGNNYGDYNNDRDGQWGNYDNHYGYESSLDSRSFERVLQSIEKEWLESNKLKSATQVVTTNRLTAAQVKELVLLFNMESNKLTLAKQAYTNTVDKRNYSIINDAFSFNSSKDELARFIRTSR